MPKKRIGIRLWLRLNGTDPLIRCLMQKMLTFPFLISCRFVAAISLLGIGGIALGTQVGLGSYKVGFKQEWLFDYGRTYQMKLAGGPSYSTKKGPRPILMNLWYPVSPSHKAKLMSRAGYLDFARGHPKLRNWLEAFQSYNLAIVCQEVMGAPKKDLNPAQAAAFQRFQNAPTHCFKKAPQATGKFPVVFYHQGYGSSVEDNTEFCEYLASWGFVVVNSSYLAADGQSFNIDSRAGSANDIRFLTAHLQRHSNVDWQRIGLIGHSGGAHTALKYRAVPGGVVDAIVSLDTTEDYFSLADPRWKFIKEDILPNLQEMAGPIMMVANPYAFFELADQFTNADRAYFTVNLDHNEFISQGVQRVRMDAALAPLAKRAGSLSTAERVEGSYGRLCTFVRHFFESKLKGIHDNYSKQTKTYLATPVGGLLPHVEVVPKGKATPPVYGRGTPTPRQIRPLIAKIGLGKVADVIRASYNKANPAPIYHPNFIFALEYDLFKQNRLDDAKAIYAAYRGLGIDVSPMFITQAWFGDVSKNYSFAEECLIMLLQLDPEHEEGRKMLVEIRKKIKK